MEIGPEGKNPIKVKELPFARVGELYILTDPETKSSIQLDPISFLIWIQCDGKTSVENIVDVFSVNGNRDIVKAAITGVLEKLTTGGLIKWV